MSLSKIQQGGILRAGRAFIGKKTYHELDCSHFVQESYSTGGLAYPYQNTASFDTLVPEFFTKITKLDVKEFEPADILMFRGHMGIWDPEGCRDLKQAGTPDAECESSQTALPFLSSRSGKDRGPDYGKVNWFGDLKAIYRWNKSREEKEKKKIIVIGSPTPEQAYPLSFIQAAACEGFTEDTIWLAEWTGYFMYEWKSRLSTQPAPASPLKYLNDNYATKSETAARFGWITPRFNLVKWLNMLSVPDGSISKLVIFSHGVPGLVALRYGWGDYNHADDYGLKAQDIDQLSGKKFSSDAQIVIQACSTGVSDRDHLPWNWQKPLAQTLANHLHRPVSAWTGRTSYAEIDHGLSCSVRGSQFTRDPFDSGKELIRRLERDLDPFEGPQQKVFQPEN